jgi:hypothetical protein
MLGKASRIESRFVARRNPDRDTALIPARNETAPGPLTPYCPTALRRGDTSLRRRYDARAAAHEVACSQQHREVAARNLRTFDAIDGLAVDLTDAEADEMRRSAGVRYFSRTIAIHAVGSVAPMRLEPYVQSRRWRRSRPSRPRSTLLHARGLAAHARRQRQHHDRRYGIDFAHADLAANIAGGYNTFTKQNDFNDDKPAARQRTWPASLARQQRRRCRSRARSAHVRGGSIDTDNGTDEKTRRRGRLAAGLEARQRRQLDHEHLARDPMK